MHTLIIIFAKYLIVVPVLVVGYLIYKSEPSKRKDRLIFVVCGGILAFILAKLGSHLHSDPRPFIKDGVTPIISSSHDNGFPSDHTLLSSYLGFAALYFNKRIGLSLLVLAALIGWARVDAGVHHLIDVIGSFVFAGAAYLITKYIYSNYKNTKDKNSKKD